MRLRATPKALALRLDGGETPEEIQNLKLPEDLPLEVEVAGHGDRVEMARVGVLRMLDELVGWRCWSGGARRPDSRSLIVGAPHAPP